MNKLIVFSTLVLIVTIHTNGQVLPTTSPYASVTQRIGITDVTVNYFRPSVNGREIWGKLVPYGYKNPTISQDDFTAAPEPNAPWRAGANNATTIEFSHDVKVETVAVQKGKYALFIAPFENGTAEIILSKPWNQAGNFVYDSKMDVARIQVKTVESNFKEELEFEFNNVKNNTAELSLRWEMLKIPLSIEVDTKRIVASQLIEDSYSPQSMNQSWRFAASVYLMTNKIELDKAEKWSRWLTTLPGAGFAQQTTYGNILLLQGKQAMADSVLNVAFSKAREAGIGILRFYGNQVLSLELPDVAIRTYNTINDLFPSNEWTVYYGLAKAYSMKKQFKEAISALKSAEKFIPENFDINQFRADMDKLKKNQDIN